MCEFVRIFKNKSADIKDLCQIDKNNILFCIICRTLSISQAKTTKAYWCILSIFNFKPHKINLKSTNISIAFVKCK